ncbi:electron transfer flavoprotein subunit alpha/FixB family protein [Thermoplasmatales archaeon AK]|nr:electron transfer flavoprotein subunit alpha/FixB family protein [Thermoplasmatales archaeon AK]
MRSMGEVYLLTPVASSVANYGAKEVYEISPPLMSDSVASAIVSLQKAHGFSHIMIGSTVIGREVAGKVAIELGLQIKTEITDLSIANDLAVTKRMFFGGKTVLEEESSARIFTVMPGFSEHSKVAETSPVSKAEAAPSRIRLVEELPKKASSVDIEKAQVIVAVGRGVGSKEGIEKVKPLADALHGELAGSRPVCLDYKWLGEERQVGLSGKKVKPKLYIALGISGQIQHIAGMRSSKVVVAVNKDKSAPIFEEADYGIVGDLFQVVSKLVKALN